MNRIVKGSMVALGLVMGGVAVGNASTLPACVHEDGSGQDACFWDAQNQGNGLGTSVTHGTAPLADLAWAAWDASGAVNLVTAPAGFDVIYVGYNTTGWVATETNEIIVTDYNGYHYLFTVHAR